MKKTLLTHKRSDKHSILPNFYEIMKLLTQMNKDNFDIKKAGNIQKTKEVLEEISGLFGRNISKDELNSFTRELILIMKKIEQSLYSVLDYEIISHEEEMSINILDSSELIEGGVEVAESLLIVANKILEIFLIIAKFGEKWENGLIAKGIFKESENNKYIKVRSSLNRELALELGNLALTFFKNQRDFSMVNREMYLKFGKKKKELVYGYLIFSFCLICCVFPNANHTIYLCIEKEKIFFFINYLLNRNVEHTEYFLISFSKIFDEVTCSKIEKTRRKKDYQDDTKKTKITKREHNKDALLDSLQNFGFNILHLDRFDFKKFFKEQFIKNATNSTIQNIMLTKRSHEFVLDIGKFIMLRIFNYKIIRQVFLETYDSEKINYTKQAIQDMFKIHRPSAEIILKELVIFNRLSGLSHLFFERCKKIDSAYIECIFICKRDLNYISFEMLNRLIESYYLAFLIQDKLIFQKLTLRVRDLVGFHTESRQGFDTDKFFQKIVKRMVVVQKEQRKPRRGYDVDDINHADISFSNLSVNLFKKHISKKQPRSYNTSFEIFERSLFFLNTFPEVLKHILPFLHDLLVTFNREYKLYRPPSKDIDLTRSHSTLSDKYFSKNSFFETAGLSISESVHGFSRIFNAKNTLIICKILNLTREFIEEWNFVDLFLKLNLKLFLENVVFNKDQKLDSLFIYALQTIIDNISHILRTPTEIFEKSCKNVSETRSEMLEFEETQCGCLYHTNMQIIDIIYVNLHKLFSESSEYHTYIVVKQINFDNLLKLEGFQNLLTRKENEDADAKNHENIKNDFFGDAVTEKTQTSYSLSGDKSLLGKKPVDQSSTEDFSIKILQKKDNSSLDSSKSKQSHSKRKTSSSTKVISFSDNSEKQPRNNNSQTKNLNIGDIDETFSNISLVVPRAAEKKIIKEEKLRLNLELLSNNQKHHLLEMELLRGCLNRDIGTYCLTSLLKDYKYMSGLALNNSKITFNQTMNNFCLYCCFYQYNRQEDQYLFKMLCRDGYIALVVRNGQLLKIRVEKDIENVILLQSPLNSCYSLGLEYNSKILKVHINDIKLSITIRKMRALEIGDNFRGIISRILCYENISYNDKYKEEIDIVHYYVKHINKLEKTCQYYNYNGVLIDSLNPYFLSKTKFNIKIENVMINERYDFLKSDRFNNNFLKILRENDDLNVILENYESQKNVLIK